MSNTTTLSEEKTFLEGPQSRRREFIFMIKVLFEFLKGFRKFHFIGPCVTVFGSARFPQDHYYYEKAKKMGAELAKLGFTVMTGGGPGLMEAANRGAREAGGRSVGCNIILPVEQTPNPYLDQWVSIDYFFIRKVLLSKYSYAFVVMPGGYGTLDEFFEALTLIQTRKIKNFPVVLIGKEYHQDLYNYLQSMQRKGTISQNDLELFLLTDSIEEAIQYISVHSIEKFNLKRKRELKPLKMLGERLVRSK